MKLFTHTNGVFTPEQDNDKTNVEPVHSYDAFHTRSDKPGVKGIIGMHRFNICLVVVLSLSCSGVKTPLPYPRASNLSFSAVSLQTWVCPQHQCTHSWPITSRYCLSLRCGAKFHMALSLSLVPWQWTACVCPHVSLLTVSLADFDNARRPLAAQVRGWEG